MMATSTGEFLTATKGRKRVEAADVLTYVYLTFGTLIMFVPILWLVMSSFKTPAALVKFPPDVLPFDLETVTVAGYDEPLPLYDVTLGTARCGGWRRCAGWASRRRWSTLPTPPKWSR
jgi:alpha-1,4-digalacturonate transport system permease protein